MRFVRTFRPAAGGCDAAGGDIAVDEFVVQVNNIIGRRSDVKPQG
jgi:hypothetical protein